MSEELIDIRTSFAASRHARVELGREPPALTLVGDEGVNKAEANVPACVLPARHR